MFYTGYSRDLKERFKKHTSGKVFSTKHRGLMELIYFEASLNEFDAKRRERFLKSGPGKKYLKNRLQLFFKSRAETR